jgi:hypothetical protein
VDIAIHGWGSLFMDEMLTDKDGKGENEIID